ncbi:MAG: MaoC family dehydratase [Acidobacteria bacterium]|nr:MaoC family dehydratase [Acidobacteriota bacterium]
MREVHGLSEVEGLAGQEVGASAWLSITQEMIDRFADATFDHQWIHCDVERATRESPYGAPVAHGFLTLSLVPGFRAQILTVTGISRVINYGVNRVRFPNAVRVDARVRGVQTIKTVERTAPGTARVVSGFVIEIEGETKPACVAETVMLLFE